MKKIYDKELWEKEGVLVPLKVKTKEKTGIEKVSDKGFSCLKCKLPGVVWDCPRCGYSHR